MRTSTASLLSFLGVSAFANAQEVFVSASIDAPFDINPLPPIPVLASTIVELALELEVDLLCLELANPFIFLLLPGETYNVPIACCGTSCKAPFCNLREECAGKLTRPGVSAPPATSLSTGSVVVSISRSHSSDSTSAHTSAAHSTSRHKKTTKKSSHSTSSTTSRSAKISSKPSASVSDQETSRKTPSSSGRTTESPSAGISKGSPASEPDSQSASRRKTTSESSASGSAGPQPSPTPLSSLSPKPPPGESSPKESPTSSPASVTQTVTDSNGKPVTFTLPPGSSITGRTTIVSDSSTVVIGPQPSPVPATTALVTQTLTDSQGHTVLTTIPPGSLITGRTTVVSDSSTIVVAPLPSSSPSSSPATTAPVTQTLTDSDGHTITTTLPPGSSVTAPVVVTSGSSKLTMVPASSPSTSASASASSSRPHETIIDGSTVSLPSSGSTTITDSKGSSIVVGPSGVISSSPSKGAGGRTTRPGSEQSSPSAGNTASKSGPSSTPASSAKGGSEPPAITPPPDGAPGSIPDDIPPKSDGAPSVEITFDGEKYFLPKTDTVELLQLNGSSVTLLPSLLISGGATITVPPITGLTTLTAANGGLSINAKPGQIKKPSTGGLSGLLGLLHALESLVSKASSIADNLESISEQARLWAAGSITDAAFGSGVGGLFDTVTGDLSDFVGSMNGVFDDLSDEVYEMTEDGMRRVFKARTGTVEAFDILKSLRKLLRGLDKVKGTTITKMKSYWIEGTVSAAILAAAEESLRNYAKYHWADETPKSSSTKSSSSSSRPSIDAIKPTKSRSKTSSSSTSSSASEKPTPYMINSKKGTSAATFKNYISTLPDGGSGMLSNYPNLNWQYYITNLTSEQAKEVASQPFVDWVAQNSIDDNDTEFGVLPPQTTNKLQKRALDDLDRRNDAPDHLKLLSQGKWHKNWPSSEFDAYLYDPTLGRGQTIYVLDSGYHAGAEDFQNTDEREIRTYVVPNKITLSTIEDQSLWAPEDMTDYRNSYHGTRVACVAAGKVRGVAPLADLVIVKFRNGFINTPSGNPVPLLIGVTYWAINDAWMFVLDDIAKQRRNGNTGKFIINMSYGWNEDLEDYVVRSALVESLIQQAWLADAVVVIAAANDGAASNPPGLHQYSPGRMGTSSNALITVGGVDANGFLWKGTTPDLGEGGSISLYAQGYQLTVASGAPDEPADAVKINEDGTSFAAPAVAGLAAYFFSLPSLDGEWHAGSIAQNMKDYLIARAWQRQDGAIDNAVPSRYPYVKPAAGSLKVAWNRAPDGLCANENPLRLKRSGLDTLSPNLVKRQSNDLGEPVVVGGSIIASNAAGLCPATSSSRSSSSPSPTPTIKSTSSINDTPASLTVVSTQGPLPTNASAVINSGFYKQCSKSPCGEDEKGLVLLASWVHQSNEAVDGCQHVSPTWQDNASWSNAKEPPPPWQFGGDQGFPAGTQSGCILYITKSPDSMDFICASATGDTELVDGLQDCGNGTSWQTVAISYL